MPIHINLLAEMQEAEEMRRRDPVKRAIFVGISLAAVALMWGALVEVKVLLADAQLTGIQQTIDSKTNLYQDAMVSLTKVAAEKSRLTALGNLNTDRFLQGDLLNALQHATIGGVRLTQVRVVQSYTSIQGKAPKGKKPPVFVNENITLHLEARDFSANPGDMINKFIGTISRQPYFQAALGKTNAVQLTGPPSALQTDAGKPYVNFSLDCRFLSHTR